MSRAYYNENDPAAAYVLRALIAEGLIAPGDVDDRSIILGQFQMANSACGRLVHGRLGIVPKPSSATGSSAMTAKLPSAHGQFYAQHLRHAILRKPHTREEHQGLSGKTAQGCLLVTFSPLCGHGRQRPFEAVEYGTPEQIWPSPRAGIHLNKAICSLEILGRFGTACCMTCTHGSQRLAVARVAFSTVLCSAMSSTCGECAIRESRPRKQYTSAPTALLLPIRLGASS